MLSTLRDQGIDVVDVSEEAEEGFAQHCREADLSTAPLRDCYSYYNGYGQAAPGSLAYYGGAAACFKYRDDAQSSLAPYVFERIGASA
jgi:hypothetical protein